MFERFYRLKLGEAGFIISKGALSYLVGESVVFKRCFCHTLLFVILKRSEISLFAYFLGLFFEIFRYAQYDKVPNLSGLDKQAKPTQKQATKNKSLFMNRFDFLAKCVISTSHNLCMLVFKLLQNPPHFFSIYGFLLLARL